MISNKNNTLGRKSYLFNAVSALSVFILMQYIYTNIIYVHFGYMGLSLKPTESSDFLLNMIFLFTIIVFSQILPKNIDSTLSLFLILFFFVIYIPGLSLLTLIIRLSLIQMISFYTMSSLSFLILKIFSLNLSRKIIVPTLSIKAYLLFFLGLLLISFSLIFYYYDFSLSSLISLGNISELYDIRWRYREQNTHIPTIAVYALTINSKILIPFLLFYGMQKKNKSIIITSFLLQFLLFMITGQKSLFLGWLYVYGFCKLIEHQKTLRTQKLIQLILFLFVLSLFLFNIGFDILLNIVLRRIFFYPGILATYYLDFFSNHPVTYLSHSILSSFIDNIYHKDPPFIIGEYYFSREEMSANANYLVSSFADFSYAGMLVYTFILASFLKLIDMTIVFKDNPKLLSLFLLPLWALLDSSLTTVFLTHGLAFGFILIVICPIHKLFKC
ncbi:hypothetical protein [Providencia sp.]|uniref:hypothetical protein n=1 Tax=Providencia sp. TaxID=589 RepID=UPI0035B4F507